MRRFQVARRLSLVLGVVAVCGIGAAQSGCSATARAPMRIDLAAKQMRPPAGYALVYILRPEFLGRAVRFDVTANGTWIGATGGNRYIYTILRPGYYVFQSRAENVASLRLAVNAGHVYYLEQRPQMGILMARNALVYLPQHVGRARLSACALSAEMPPRVLRMAAIAQVAAGSGAPPPSHGATTSPPPAPVGPSSASSD